MVGPQGDAVLRAIDKAVSGRLNEAILGVGSRGSNVTRCLVVSDGSLNAMCVMCAGAGRTTFSGASPGKSRGGRRGQSGKTVREET